MLITPSRTRKVALLLAIPALFVAAVYLCLSAYLATPAAARRASRLLTAYLRTSATVTRLVVAGDGVRIEGLTVANPAGFSGPFLKVRSFAVEPVWTALLRGERRLRAVEIEGLQVDLKKNGRGDWNAAGFRHLAAGKRTGGETFIGRLVLRDAALRVNGRTFFPLSASVRNLSTAGSVTSGLTLDLTDDGGNPLHVTGSARLGAVPEGTLTLNAPSVRLAPYARFLKQGSPLRLAEGKGSISVAARVRGKEVSLAGSATAGFHVALGGDAVPLRCSLRFDGGYRGDRDEATLKTCTLTVNDRFRLDGSGMITDLRGRGRFTARLVLNPFDMAPLWGLLPQKVRRDVAIRGEVETAIFNLSGDRKSGIAAGGGKMALTRGEIHRGKTVIADGLTATALLKSGGAGWKLSGRVAGSGSGGTLMERLDLPFVFNLSSRFRGTGGEIGPAAVRARGVDATGGAVFAPAASAPYRVRLSVPPTAVTRLQSFIPGETLTLSAGTASFEMEGGGTGPETLAGRGRLRLAGVGGSRGGKAFRIGSGDVAARFSGLTEAAALEGEIAVADCDVAGKKADGHFAYAVKKGTCSVSGGGGFDRYRFGFAALEGVLPRRDAAGRLPLVWSLRGGEVRGDEVALAGINGSVSAVIPPGGIAGGEGTASVTVGSTTYRGRGVTPLAAVLSLGAGAATADISATPFGGRLSGTIGLNPANPRQGGSYRIAVADLDVGRLTETFSSGKSRGLTAGKIGAEASGSIASGSGVGGAFTVTGTGVSVAVTEGKTAVAGAEFSVRGALGGDRLVIEEGRVTIPGGASLTGNGEVKGVSRADRAGTFRVVLASTPVSSLFDDFVNVMPRSLQEAEAKGFLSGHATARLQGSDVATDGEVAVSGLALDLPSQKLAIAGVEGTVPFSIDSRGTLERRADMLTFSRENYPLLLAAMQGPGGGDHLLTVGTVRLGEVAVTGSRFYFHAGNGRTDITSIQVPLFGGAIRGTGSFLFADGPVASADVLIGDLSLRELCNAFPPIRGYITGKVDGIVSLRREKGGALQGYVDLWTESRKGEERLVSKEFLQKLAGQKLKGIFFRNDRPYDTGEIVAYVEKGYLTFATLDISHTNFFGVKDINVSVAPAANRIALDHLFETIRTAAARGKGVAGEGGGPPVPQTEFKWEE